jgi:hypothetical protein
MLMFLGVARRVGLVFLLTVLLALFGAASAAAATITVNSLSDAFPVGGAPPGTVTLRSAIGEANSISSPSTINFSVGGTIVLVLGPLLVAPPTGAPLTITGLGANELTVDGNGAAGPNGGVFVVNNAAATTMSGLTVTGGNVNTNLAGAGIDYTGTAPLVLNRVVVAGNTASNVGASAGGVRQDGSNLTILDSTIDGNDVSSNSTGGNAGGIFNNAGSLTLTNTTVAGNAVTGAGTNPDGGGVLNLAGLTTVNATIAGNSAAFGTGGVAVGSGSSSTPANTIIATNSGSAASDCGGTGTVSSQGHNLVGSDSGCVFTASTGDEVGTSGSPINPLLGPLANNGGPTPTLALQPASPAIDAGNPAACPTTDQRAFPRPDMSGTPCDIGAYEFQGTPTRTLTVTLAGSGSGTVTSSPAGIACGGTCSTSFAAGSMVTLTATPGSGSTFTGWSGAACSGTGTCTVTMSSGRSVTATFTAQPGPSGCPDPAGAHNQGFNIGFNPGFNKGFASGLNSGSHTGFPRGFHHGFGSTTRPSAVNAAGTAPATRAHTVPAECDSQFNQAFNTAFNVGFNSGFQHGFNSGFNNRFNAAFRAKHHQKHRRR